MAPVSVGAVCVGLIAIGNLSLGVISLGTVGIGMAAFGVAAVGLKAYGWLSALGWETAQGSGFAIARIAAEGPVAFAAHTNDAIARGMLVASHAEQNQTTFVMTIAVLSLIPIVFYARAVRQRLGRNEHRGK